MWYHLSIIMHHFRFCPIRETAKGVAGVGKRRYPELNYMRP